MEQLPTVLIPASRNPSTRAVGVRYKPPKGRTETQFEQDLWHYFPGKIHTGLMMQRSALSQPYTPDFAYLDADLDLSIDIEIDEPYSHVTRQPLHYLECLKDQQRNAWFLAGGWVVIRFSEEQIVRSPASCCKTIASTIARLTGNSAVMIPFRQVPTLKPQRRWTEAAAIQMAAQAYREQYAAVQPPANPSDSTSRKRRKQPQSREQRVMTTNFTFFCPECGEGPIRWQGHYICCPTCSYDAFAF